MTRRRLVALVSGTVILAIVIVIAGAVLATTRTDFGRERIRRLVAAQLRGAVGKRGTVYVGHITGSILNEIAIDSFSLRDAEDSLFLATGPLRVTFDPRDLIDQRLHFHSVDITRANVYLRRHGNDVWNFNMIFPPAPKRTVIHTRGIGDYIVADSVVLHDATFTLTERWDPDDSLKGPRRDSAVRFALKREWPEVRHTKEGLKRTRRWTHLELRAPWVRIAHPDSIGQMIVLGSMGVMENDPPTQIRNMRGTVRIHGDSIWLALSHFDFPATTGHATGRVWWGGGRPVQVDLAAVADSVSLKDFSWIYAGLPRSGGGRTEVNVRNDPKNLHVLNYALKKLDLRTTNSHLRGDMTFGVGGPVLVMKDVAMSLEPADFDLLRTFNGGTFPVDFRGRFTGTVHAAGGPINRWKVDSADLTYHDTHVPDAVTHITARGEIDLLFPSLAKFRGFDVGLDALDLRTITYLFPTFPRLGGTLTGRATLDSIWTDVRFRNADISHHDGPDPASRATGSGRVTYGGDGPTEFDVTLDAAPLSFGTFARSYPSLPLRGTMSGPMRVQGTTDRLAVAARLTGEAGTLTVDELIDIDSLNGQGARGTVRAEALDIARLLGKPSLPRTRLFAFLTDSVHGDSLATMRGALTLTLDTSSVAAVWIPHASARAELADGHLRFDSLSLISTGVRVTGTGMIGLAAGTRDTLRFNAQVDSLGGLRSVFGGRARPVPRDTSAVLASELLARARSDSLDGALTMEGLLTGSLADSFTASATFLGERMVLGANRAARVAGGFDISGLPRAAAGSVWLRFDSAVVSGVGIDTLHAQLALGGPDGGIIAIRAATDRPMGAFRGDARLRYHTAADSMRIALEALQLETNGHRWTLDRPATYTSTKGGDALDSLLLRGGAGTIAMHADLPVAGEIRAGVTVDSLALADVGAFAQTYSPLGGFLSGALTVTGTRDAPVMKLTSRVRGAKYGSILFPYFSLDADYANRHLASRIDFFDHGQSVATLALGLSANLALHAVPERFPDEPVTGRLSADSVNLAVLSTFSPVISQLAGRATADIAISGTRSDPLFTGRMKVSNGEVGLPRFGVRLTAVQADVGFAPGVITLDTLSMKSGSVGNNFMSLTGTIHAPNMLALRNDRTALVLDLRTRARNFQLLDSRRLARVEVTDSVVLIGKFSALTLTGRIAVEKADFYISDLSRKTTVVDLDDPELFADPAVAASRELVSSIPPDVRDAMANLRVDNLEVTIGDKVWLRSAESDIKLGGAVQIKGSGSQQLTGRIDVERGTYRLDLGLVQRTFQVDSGTVSFYGDTERGGVLNVWASSTVRQANRQGEDVKILAHITGTTDAPLPEFSSGERFALSQSEILSYLIFGQPSFFATNDTKSTVASTLLPSLGTVMESALSKQLRFVDQITIQTGANSTAQQNEQNLAALYGSRFGIGKQIGKSTYVSANAGLCWLSSASTGANSFSQSLGLSVEQRLGNRFVLQASQEPSSAALLCKPGSTNIGSYPRQYGIDLFREWSF
jgi:translocation and assembly module TamB